jgi:phenylpropionate dioxygenase-like ring-hydroxylating dioxygenase large terminal subunit
MADQSRERLVDRQSGRISREIFVNEDLYQQERERVFGRAWLYIGHESQVREPGDFALSRMGEESVIMTRDRQGAVQVMLNSCRHRGMRVCRYDEGRTSKFYCPYHGWAYELDGALSHVTEFEAEYGNHDFDKKDWGLIKVAKVHIVRGTVWATWDPNADFDAYFGDARQMLDLSFCGWDGESEVEVIGSTQKWIIPSNWKIVAENFAGDMLHVVSHRSVDIVGIGPNGEQGRRDSSGSRIVQASYPEGHAGIFGMFDRDDPRRDYSASPITAEYFQHCWEKRKKVLGDQAFVTAAVGTIFPNMSFHGNQPRTILVAHPLGVDRTEVWRQYFVDKDAPAEVKNFLRGYYIKYSGPAGMTEQDDMENWNYATWASKGMMARQFPYNYGAGLGNETTEAALPGAISSGTTSSESNARSYYSRWQEYMAEGKA